jgi:glycosyltransferase involved in cell wall biosynthesis
VDPFLKPLGRALKYRYLKRRAERLVAGLDAQARFENLPAAAFLIGCGRSGTTIVGEVLGRHPGVQYFFEPYHLWATIDPTLDVLNLYFTGHARFIADSQHFTVEAQRRFNRLLLEVGRDMGASLVIEKTPFNACRLGYLECLSPGAKYVHLIRDGVDVARSIDKLSKDKSYQISGKPMLNRWWGRGGCKWTSLAEDGIAAGYFTDEIPLLKSYEAKGAYEWVVSVAEVDRWRSRLGDRLLEMSYDELTAGPNESMKKICAFLGLSMPANWSGRAISLIDSARRNAGRPLVLPPRLCEEFNRLQERFGYENRAVEGMPEEIKVQVAIISNEPTPYRVHVLNRLARELDSAHIHNIFTHTISNPSMPWEMQIGAHVNPVFFPQYHLTQNRPISMRSWPLYRVIRKFVEEKNVDLIILLGYNDLTRMLMIGWARRRGIRILLAGDSNVFAEGRLTALIRQAKRPYVRWVLRRLDGLMPMGTCGRAFFRLYMDHNLPEFLFPYEPDYDGLSHVDPEKMAAFCKKFNLAPDRKRLIYCGRLIDVKCVDVLIRAFARVASSRPQWDLVIAGDGPLRGYLESLVPPALKNRVKWLGFLQFDQIVFSYHTCDVLVHPSQFEPWGLVINEAVCCQLPVIATSVVGAAVELVRHQHNGLIVTPRSVDAMTDAIWQITIGDRHLEMRRYSAEMLDNWRSGADPVDGVVQALQHFGLLWRQPRVSKPPKAPIETDIVVAQSAS